MTSPLHLAAASGWIECVNELILSDHPVDCIDRKGWSPLLYAHFQNHQDCVLALMEAKPEQVRFLFFLIVEGVAPEAKIVVPNITVSRNMQYSHLSSK